MTSGDTEPYPSLSGQDNATVPLPRAVAEAPGATPRRRRARWPWVLLVVVIVLGALVVAGEFLARGIVKDTIRAEVLKAMNLPDDQQLEVEANGLMLPQLIVGQLDDVRLASERIALGPLTGAIDVRAQGVPLRGGAIDSLEGAVRLDETQFTALLANTELPIDEIDVVAPNVVASGNISFFGVTIPLSLTLLPGVVDGDLTIEPVSATIAGATLNAEQLRNQFGSVAEGLTSTQRICIADQLPAGLHLTGLDIKADDVIAHLVADGEIANDPSLLENGVCPTS